MADDSFANTSVEALDACLSEARIVTEQLKGFLNLTGGRGEEHPVFFFQPENRASADQLVAITFHERAEFPDELAGKHPHWHAKTVRQDDNGQYLLPDGKRYTIDRTAAYPGTRNHYFVRGENIIPQQEIEAFDGHRASRLAQQIHSTTQEFRSRPLPAQLSLPTNIVNRYKRRATRLAACVLRVRPSSLEALANFYKKSFGMEVERTDPGFVELVVPGAPLSCSLRLVADEQVTMAYRHKGRDIYWKIGLAINDVQSASRNLGASPGNQFLDIGFLTHLADPVGFTIELLQTTFEENVAERARRLAMPVRNGGSVMGQDFVIGQITTRITDPKRSLHFYQEVLKMKLMSVQPVKPYRFTLYFLAYTEEDPPNATTLEAVENRPWLWQRCYTTLELQHRWDDAPSSLAMPKREQEGLQSIFLRLPPDHMAALQSVPGYAGLGPGKARLQDPDGLPVEVETL